MPGSRSSPSRNDKPAFLNAGESAVVVEFGRTVDERLHDRVLALDAALAKEEIDGIVETVPTYRSLMVHYDPCRLGRDEIVARIEKLLGRASRTKRKPARWVVPVCYDPPHAEDLAEVARTLGLEERRVVEIFSGATYRLYMYGFLPGFVYLGTLPRELEIPRRERPRSPVPTGAILIVTEQVVVTGVTMQTGWFMIGRTPERIFDVERDPPFIFAVGDEIVFEPIDAATYARLEHKT